MRAVVIVVLLAVGLPAACVAATVDAVGYCVAGLPGRGCDEHLACLNPRGDGRNESCALAIPELDDVLPVLLP